jgi:hypothetical protein
MPIPSDGTTSSHNIKEDGNAIRTRPWLDHSVPEDVKYKSNVQVSKSQNIPVK